MTKPEPREKKMNYVFRGMKNKENKNRFPNHRQRWLVLHSQADRRIDKLAFDYFQPTLSLFD